jgi:hypothetical protein
MYNPETYGFYDAYLKRFQDEARWSMELKRAAVRVPTDTSMWLSQTWPQGPAEDWPCYPTHSMSSIRQQSALRWTDTDYLTLSPGGSSLRVAG